MGGGAFSYCFASKGASGAYDGGAMKFAAKVRAGLVPFVRRELLTLLKSIKAVACPFVNIPDANTGRWGGGVTIEQMSEMQWVRPELVVQIRFVEWTVNVRPRFCPQPHLVNIHVHSQVCSR